MKTAISIPDETFARAERLAEEHNMTRSQFYSVAVARYAESLESELLTAAIDAALEAAGPDDSATFATTAAAQLFQADEDEW